MVVLLEEGRWLWKVVYVAEMASLNGVVKSKTL